MSFPPHLMKYQVGKDWWIASLGRKVYPGEVVELPDDVAAPLLHNEPGLLAPVRLTTQARPKGVRGRPATRRKK